MNTCADGNFPNKFSRISDRDSFAASLFVFAILLSLFHPVLAAENTREAESAAIQWLALSDSRKYGESWDRAASLFQAAIPREQWVIAMQAMRSQLGVTQSRLTTTSKFAKTLPGAPEGEYVVVQFQRDFANKAGATESVTPMKDTDGTWKVSVYFIR